MKRKWIQNWYSKIIQDMRGKGGVTSVKTVCHQIIEYRFPIGIGLHQVSALNPNHCHGYGGFHNLIAEIQDEVPSGMLFGNSLELLAKRMTINQVIRKNLRERLVVKLSEQQQRIYSGNPKTGSVRELLCVTFLSMILGDNQCHFG